MNKTSRIGVVENTGPNTLVSFLRNAGEGAASIDLAVAFLTSTGVDAVLYVLKKVARRGSVRVLTGLYQGFTEPVALRKLYRVQKETKGRLSVSISRDGHFHWKCYFVKHLKTANLSVGSSNLTGDGLQQSGEFNVVITVPIASRPYRNITSIFEKHWAEKSSPLTDSVLTKYEKWKDTIGGSSPRPAVPVREILGGKPATSHTKKLGDRRFWRTGINGDLDDETVVVLKDTTDWGRRGYLYFSTWNSSYRNGDRVVLFDLADKVVRPVEILDTTETPVVTPDGVHFAAYRAVRGGKRRRLVPSRWRFLKQSRLLERRGDAASTRKLSEATYERFVENLREKATAS